MPRKSTTAKDAVKAIEEKKEKIKVAAKKPATTSKKTDKKVDSDKKDTTKKVTKKTTTIKSESPKKSTKTAAKKITTKKVAAKKDAVKTTKDSSKKETTKKAVSKKETASKSPKKETKKEEKKVVAKKTEKEKNEAVEKSKKIVKQGEDIKPKESVVIAKIKSFLKKIVEMQEEAKKEQLAENEKETKKIEKKLDKEIEKAKKLPYNIEYYDLPYRYNETVVKILAQTPKRLFVYWDISDDDRAKYTNTFGDNFFNETYPVLLVHNDDKNYTFEVPINDFANSWYLDIADSKSKYTIQLGRKFKEQSRVGQIDYGKVNDANILLQNDYLPITTSNSLEAPNDHILFENIKPYVIYRNVKNYNEFRVDINNLAFAQRMGKIYNIYDVYKTIYKKEMDDESLLDLLNPSSSSRGRGIFGNGTSGMPSSHTSSTFK